MSEKKDEVKGTIKIVWNTNGTCEGCPQENNRGHPYLGFYQYNCALGWMRQEARSPSRRCWGPGEHQMPGDRDQAIIWALRMEIEDLKKKNKLLRGVRDDGALFRTGLENVTMELKDAAFLEAVNKSRRECYGLDERIRYLENFVENVRGFWKDEEKEEEDDD
jgi:FtsZ-binding cell division protein ZapB